MLDDAEVQRRLEYRPPTDATRPAYEMSRALVRLLFEVWNRTLPPGREAALTLTALEEAHFWSNAAVARNAGPDWSLPHIDVSTYVDDVLEHLEGPLHTRSSGSGTPRDPEGSEGPDSPPGGPLGGEIVPPEGLAATHLTPEQVQGLIERSGPRGPADELARRERVLEALEREIARQRAGFAAPVAGRAAPPGPGSGRIAGSGGSIGPEVGSVAPSEGAERLERGDCAERVPGAGADRCELVAGHELPHRHDRIEWR